MDTGIKIIEFEEIDSTNEEAKRRVRAALAFHAPAETAEAPPPSAETLADPLRPLFGTALCARSQTHGRGRRGKAFASPGTGDSVYITFIMEPFGEFGMGDGLTLAAGVAVCRAIERTLPELSPPPKIKWVNDVFLDGKKICGILAEAITDPKTNKIAAIALGIGININLPKDALPDELQKTAGSLALPPNIRTRFIEILSKEVNCYASLAATDQGKIMQSYRARELAPPAPAAY